MIFHFIDRIGRKVFWTELTEFIELGLDRRGRRVFLDRMTGFAGDYRMGRKGFFDRINRINRIGFGQERQKVFFRQDDRICRRLQDG